MSARYQTGESGRPRLPLDSYPTPAPVAAGLFIGLSKLGVDIPPIIHDCCGGEGQLARVGAAPHPNIKFALSDIRPHAEAADLYATLEPVDATNLAELESALRLTGAKAVISNFPFKQETYGLIFANCLFLLSHGDIELLCIMQRAQRALDCAIGAVETAEEPYFHATIACAWRPWLFPKRPGDASPKGAYAWHVYRSTPRWGRAYPVVAVMKIDAEAELAAAGWPT